MRNIMAALDVGSAQIKLIIGEIIKNKVNILACVETPARGIKKGFVINMESATEALSEVFKNAEDLIGLPIKKVITSVPSTYAECFLASGTVATTSPDKVINNNDIIKVMQKCVYNKIPEHKELVSIIPASFMINDEVVSNPLNMISEKISMKGIVVTVPKKNVEGISTCLKNIGVDLVDVVISPLGDFYEHKQKSMNKEIGALINIGEETTTVSIFNRGILTNLETIDIGGGTITNDLAYVYKISLEDAKYVKEHLALAHTRLAQPNESLTFKDKYDESVKINAYDASEIVMGRLTEIINLAKKQINLLTKKEISYIIFTGGVTESGDFDILIEDILGNLGIIGKVEEIGARNNKYATAVGMIKYYNSRLKLRNTEFSIFNLEEQEELGGLAKRANVADNSLLGKIFGYFFDN